MTEGILRESRFRARIGWSQIMEKIAGPLFVAPALLFYIPFVVLPTIATFGVVFFKWTGTGLQTMHFAGLANFKELVTDDVFWTAVANNFRFGAVIVPCQLLIGLFVALMMVQERRFFRLFQTLFLIPMTLSGVVVAVVFNLLFSPTYDVLNSALRVVGLGFLANPWLASLKTARMVIVIVSLWGSFAFSMLVFTARIKSISRELFDAALVDGASWLQQTWYVTLPLLRDVSSVLIMLSVINIFRMFGTVFILTEGGPNNVTQVLAVYAYMNGFYYSRMGYGTTISAVLLLICATLTGLQMRFFRREEVE